MPTDAEYIRMLLSVIRKCYEEEGECAAWDLCCAGAFSSLEYEEYADSFWSMMADPAAGTRWLAAQGKTKETD